MESKIQSHLFFPLRFFSSYLSSYPVIKLFTVLLVSLQYCWPLCPPVLKGSSNVHPENAFHLHSSVILRRTVKMVQKRSFVVCWLCRKTFCTWNAVFVNVLFNKICEF